MCGIAGYVGSRRIEERVLRSCLAGMRRRGPDAEGILEHQLGDRRAVLLHTRLRIIDLDARANQPLRFGSKSLVFNGELYNYLELREDLERRGHRFETDSDTEVLLRVLAQDGVDGLDRCEGMWAFALYDASDGSLLLCRDRFGEKPLYVAEDETGLYFASEVKFLFLLMGRRAPVNFPQLYRYLVNGYRSLYKTGEGFFEGVRELPRATALRVETAAKPREQVYWRPQVDPDESLTREQAVEGAREALVEAVRIRLRADVPIAFCMSGGVDSQSLIGIAARCLGYDVHGFTIASDDPRYDERELAAASARELGIRHTLVPISHSGFLPGLRELVRQHDAPVYTITYYLHWLLMRSVAEHGYRISVSGTAADELFSGYYDHHALYLHDVQDTELFEPALAAWRKHIAPIVRNPLLQDPLVFVRDPELRDHLYLDAPEFARFLRSDWREGFTEACYADSLLRNRMLNELFHEVTPAILHEDDLNAMYFSIENRSPYLDRRLFELCNRIPTRHLVHQGFAKSVLREAMEGIVPARALWERRKVGFNASLHSLLDVKDASVREWILDDGPIYEHVRRPMIEELLGEPELPNSRSKFLFYFLASKVFLEEVAP